MSTEDEMVERRSERERSAGPGAAMVNEVKTRQTQRDSDEGLKYYRRKGLGNVDNFEYAKMYQFGYDPIVREDDTSLIPNEYAKERSRTIFGHDMSNGNKINNMDHEPTAIGSIGRVIVGGAVDIAQGAVSLAVDVQDAMGIPMDPTLRAASKLAMEYSPEWLDESAGWGEDIARDVAQFAGGYAGAIKGLGKMGMKSSLKKDVAASIASGQTFDPEEGNLGTMLNDFGLLPEQAAFLDSKLTTEQEGRFQGRMAMAMEEIGFGGLASSIRGAGNVMKSTKRRYKAYGNEMMKQGAMKYGKATSVISHPTKGLGADEVVDEATVTEALDMIASGFQMTGGNNAGFMAMAKESGIDKNLAKKAWNNAAKEKLARLSSFAAPDGPTTSMMRQKGAIDTQLGISGDDRLGDILRPDQAYTIADMKSFFNKRTSRGQMSSAQRKEEVDPVLKMLEEKGINSVTGDQLSEQIRKNRPEFKTVIKDEYDARFKHETNDPSNRIDVRESEMQGRPVPNHAIPSNMKSDMKSVKMVPDSYKEHLFISRNPLTEAGGSYVNNTHHAEKYVKGMIRTNLLEPSGAGGKKTVVVQELQSDAAASSAEYGQHSDEEIKGWIDKFPDFTKENVNELSREISGFLDKEMNVDYEKSAGFDWIDDSMEYILRDAKTSAETKKSLVKELRKQLATPSPFNEDKNWVRQTLRPVMKEAKESGSSRIMLANPESVRRRYQHEADDKKAPFNRYLSTYPKIMKRYFKEIGVPEKNIYMPTNVNESFYVDIPPEILENLDELPLY